MNIFQINLLLMFIYFMVFRYVFHFKNYDIILNRVIAIQLFIILGFRSQTVGTDLIRYEAKYDFVSSTSFSEIFKNIEEPGYVFLEWITIRLHIDFQVFLIILAFINIVVVAYIIEEYSDSIFVSWILYIGLGIYSFNFSGLRQALAMSFIFLSFHFLYNNKMMVSITFYIIASLMHTTAIIFGLVYIIVKMKFSKKKILFLSSLFLIAIYFRRGLSYVMLLLFREGRYVSEYTRDNTADGTFFIFALVLVIITLITNPPWKNEDRIYKFYFTFLILFSIIQMFSLISYTFTRLNFYFLQMLILFLPYMFKNLSGHKFIVVGSQWKYVYNVLIIILVAVSVIYYLQGFNGRIIPYDILPYTFMWQ